MIRPIVERVVATDSNQNSPDWYGDKDKGRRKRVKRDWAFIVACLLLVGSILALAMVLALPCGLTLLLLTGHCVDECPVATGTFVPSYTILATVHPEVMP
jgi:hypothetical protein